MIKEGQKIEGIRKIVLSGKVEQAMEAAAPILNNLYMYMDDARAVVDYFTILDILHSLSMHRVQDNPVKEIILFHSRHAGLYYAIWYGLYDTLVEMSSIMSAMQQIYIIAAEIDYPLADFTTAILDSIKAYSATLEANGEKPSDQHAYTDAPMNFTNPIMEKRFKAFS